MSRCLFVCMGNVCRSPMALAVARKMALDAGRRLGAKPARLFDAAGTHACRGDRIDARAAAALSGRGYAPAGLRARRVVADDFLRFERVIAMDHGNLDALRDICPAHLRAKLGLLLDHAPAAACREIPDPYYGGAEGFERVLDLCEAGVRGLLDDLMATLPPVPASRGLTAKALSRLI